MRLDKFLKTARLVKRRTVAQELCQAGRVQVNDRVAKPGTVVKVGDVLSIRFGTQTTMVKILNIQPVVKKEQAAGLYQVLGIKEQ